MKLFAILKTIASNDDLEEQKIVEKNLKLLAALGFSEGPKIKKRRIEVTEDQPLNRTNHFFPRKDHETTDTYIVRCGPPRLIIIGEEQIEYFEEEI